MKSTESLPFLTKLKHFEVQEHISKNSSLNTSDPYGQCFITKAATTLFHAYTLNRAKILMRDLTFQAIEKNAFAFFT